MSTSPSTPPSEERTVLAGANAISAPLLTAVFVPKTEDEEWVGHLKKGFIGDILACLSITMAVASTPAADGAMVS
jgi:hypothetical protein